MIDGAAASEGADQERRHADPVAVGIDGDRLDVIVKASPVVPGDEDRGVQPLLFRARHHGVDELRDPCLAVRDGVGRVFAAAELGTTHETEGRVAARGRLEEFRCGSTLLNCWVASTVLNPGSGFMIGLIRSAPAEAWDRAV